MKTKKPTVQKDDMAKKQLEDQLKRALADYQNLERRVEEERRLLGALSSAILIEKFLPVLDNLESAQSHLSDPGLEIVIKQFKDILNQEGVEEIQTEGQTFDPNMHEAVEVAEGENDNTIVKTVRKGYKINNKVLRPAQVVVEKASQSSQATESQPESQEEPLDPPEEMNQEATENV